MSKRLYRSETDKMLAGVCGGFAEVYDMDPVLVRLMMVLFGLVSAGTALLFYLVATIIVPRESQVKGREKKDSEEETEEEE